MRGKNPLPPGRAAFRRFHGARLPRSPAFNERRVGDKPREIRTLDRLGGPAIAEIERRWHCTLGAMVEVDRQVGRLMKELRRDGELRRTIVIYISDNGFCRSAPPRIGKGFVYEPALNVPFVMRVPRPYRNSAVPRRLDSVVSNQDLAPTLLDYDYNGYGGSADSCMSPGDCRRMDGRTLRPFSGVLVSRCADVACSSRSTRGGPPSATIQSATAPITRSRTSRYVYSELATGERELYDLRTDPHELRNKAGSAAYAEREHSLAARLDLLGDCSGVEGRDPPALVPYCE